MSRVAPVLKAYRAKHESACATVSRRPSARPDGRNVQGDRWSQSPAVTGPGAQGQGLSTAFTSEEADRETVRSARPHGSSDHDGDSAPHPTGCGRHGAAEPRLRG